MKTRRQNILDTADDLMGSFLYYDRKEDDDLPRGAIEDAIKNGEIDVDDIIAVFRKAFD